MTRYRIYFLLILLTFQVQLALAQCKDNSFERLDINKVSARFNNGGNMFWDMFGTSDYEVPKGSGLHPTFAGSLWVGGLDPQNALHVSASTYRQSGWEWYAGPARNPVGYLCEATITAPSSIFLNGVKRLRNGKCLVLSGTEVIIYDPLTGTILSRPLPGARLWMDGIELQDGRVMLFGDDTYPVKNPVLYMDTVTYNIVGGPTLHWFHKESSINQLQDGRLLLAGVVGCEILDPTTNLSSPVPDMIWPRQKHATIMLPNGNIMAFGGGAYLGGTGQTYATQYFDDSLGYWFPGPTMFVARQRARATQMPDGKVFVSGGSSLSRLTEIYDPGTNSFSIAASLPDFAGGHTVQVTDSDEVFIASESVSTGNLVVRNYRFNIYSGAFDYIHIQIGGARMVGIDSNEVLLQVLDNKHLQRLNIRTALHDGSRWQHVWKVSRAEIQQFQADFLANQVDFSRYPHIEIWPAHGNEALGEDRNLAPFVDVNQDGRYQPALDGDYPCIVGDQALWWVYNDLGPHLETQGIGFGMQVEAMAYAFDCSLTPCPDSALDYATFLHLELSNHSNTAYHDMYVGNHQDFDLGSFLDDYFATDSTRNLTIGFNADDADPNYGIHPPAFGCAVMPNGQIGTMAGSMLIDNTFGSFNSNPIVPSDYYNYLRSRFTDSLQMVNNGLVGHPSLGPGPSTHFQYSSTDGFCGGPLTGWSEYSAGNTPMDRRFLQSSGPFSLNPGQDIEWDLGYFYARDSSNLLSVCKLQNNTSTIQAWWQNQLDRSCFNTVVTREEPLQSAGFKVYPNPAHQGDVQLDFGTAVMEAGDLQVIDLQGRVLSRHALQMGDEGLRLGTQGLPAGMYLLRLQAGARCETQRLILE